jgi:Uma2 family endonuclease
MSVNICDEKGSRRSSTVAAKEAPMRVTPEQYRRIALEDRDGAWELHRGRLRQKPAGSFVHNQTVHLLADQTYRQIDSAAFTIRVNCGRVSGRNESYYVPDLFVVPRNLIEPDWSAQDVLETYGQPLPLVVEVWSPSTGGYDVDASSPSTSVAATLKFGASIPSIAF